MTHQIKDKIAQIEEQLKQTVDSYNKVSEQRTALFNQATALQGALQALKEVDHEHDEDPSSDPEPA